jgi:Carboxypeptidase regulatory-like domain/TonB-dependent Receptor Plug Domain
MVRRALFLLMALLVTGSPAMAQALRGTVVDSASGKPVAGAHLLVSVAGGTAVSDTATDKDGRFNFALPAAGQYVLRVSRVGYSPRLTQPIPVERDLIAAVELRLTPLAVLLDTVTVVAEKVLVEQLLPFLVDAGFYERRSKGIGHFLTRADLDKHPPDRMTNAFQGMSGVHVVCGGRTSSSNACDVQAPGATTMFKRGVCKPSVVLDGVVLRAGGVLNTESTPESRDVDRPVDELLNPFNIEAVEIYTSPAGVPVQYIGYLSPCGAIIAWSRR